MKRSLKLLTTLALTLSYVQSQAMTTQGTQIVDSNGQPVTLKGINWFGFNNGATMVDGLWAGPDGLSMDFATVVYRMQLLGFNAVRLPFSFNDLFHLAPRNLTQNSPTATQSEIQASVTDPSVTVPSGAVIPPQNSPPDSSIPGVANSYLPNDTTLNRFLWVVNFFAKNGFYVLIDDHREDQTVLQDPNQWVQDWVQLVTAICQDPVSKKMLMVDILNEPDGFGIRWEASSDKPGLKDLYFSVMDALYPIHSELLFFVEGTGQGVIGANWGDGFATDPNLISQYGLSDPNPFFQELLIKPYVDQVVISPHVYPPTVTHATSNYSGTGLWDRMTNSFGYLTEQGYCQDTCKVFPIAIGEFGSTFTDSQDLQSMPDIASYLNNSGAAADGKHQAIGNWFYWDWNANSGDTGGIVDDSWRTIIWQKVEYLTTIGLTPWYMGSLPPPTLGSLCITVDPAMGLQTSNLQPIIVGAYSFSITDFSNPVCQSVNAGSYTINVPDLTVGDMQYKASAQTVQVTENQTTTVEVVYEGTPITLGSCIVEVELGTSWQEGNRYYNVINLYFQNTGTDDIEAPWDLTLSNSDYLGVASTWNVEYTSIQDGVITASANSGDWESLVHNSGNKVNLGLIVSSSSPSFMPTQITVNEVPCMIQSQ